MFKVITISRQFGSGGRTVGKEVAARLNIPCYDKEILEKVAANSGCCEEYTAANTPSTAPGWAGLSEPRPVSTV